MVYTNCYAIIAFFHVVSRFASEWQAKFSADGGLVTVE